MAKKRKSELEDSSSSSSGSSSSDDGSSSSSSSSSGDERNKKRKKVADAKAAKGKKPKDDKPKEKLSAKEQKAKNDKKAAEKKAQEAKEKKEKDAKEAKEKKEREAKEKKEKEEREAQEAKDKKEKEAQEAKDQKEKEAQEAKDQKEKEAQEAKDKKEKDAQDINDKKEKDAQDIKDKKEKEAQEAKDKKEKEKEKPKEKEKEKPKDKKKAAVKVESESSGDEEEKQRKAEEKQRKEDEKQQEEEAKQKKAEEVAAKKKEAVEEKKKAAALEKKKKAEEKEAEKIKKKEAAEKAKRKKKRVKERHARIKKGLPIDDLESTEEEEEEDKPVTNRFGFQSLDDTDDDAPHDPNAPIKAPRLHTRQYMEGDTVLYESRSAPERWLVAKIRHVFAADSLVLEYEDGTILKEDADPKRCKKLFQPGEFVEYLSETAGGRWISCKVDSVNDFGMLDLVFHDGMRLKKYADPGRVRKGYIFTEGESVEYCSRGARGRWIPCVVGKVHMDTGRLKLVYHHDGSVMKDNANPDEVRKVVVKVRDDNDVLPGTEFKGEYEVTGLTFKDAGKMSAPYKPGHSIRQPKDMREWKVRLGRRKWGEAWYNMQFNPEAWEIKIEKVVGVAKVNCVLFFFPFLYAVYGFGSLQNRTAEAMQIRAAVITIYFSIWPMLCVGMCVRMWILMKKDRKKPEDGELSEEQKVKMQFQLDHMDTDGNLINLPVFDCFQAFFFGDHGKPSVGIGMCLSCVLVSAYVYVALWNMEQHEYELWAAWWGFLSFFMAGLYGVLYNIVGPICENPKYSASTSKKPDRSKMPGDEDEEEEGEKRSKRKKRTSFDTDERVKDETSSVTVSGVAMICFLFMTIEAVGRAWDSYHFRPEGEIVFIDVPDAPQRKMHVFCVGTETENHHVALVHGAFGTHYNWWHVQYGLQWWTRVCSVDLHGHWSWLITRERPATDAVLARDFLEALRQAKDGPGGKNVILAGQGWGSAVVQQAAWQETTKAWQLKTDPKHMNVIGMVHIDGADPRNPIMEGVQGSKKPYVWTPKNDTCSGYSTYLEEHYRGEYPHIQTKPVPQVYRQCAMWWDWWRRSRSDKVPWSEMHMCGKDVEEFGLKYAAARSINMVPMISIGYMRYLNWRGELWSQQDKDLAYGVDFWVWGNMNMTKEEWRFAPDHMTIERRMLAHRMLLRTWVGLDMERAYYMLNCRNHAKNEVLAGRYPFQEGMRNTVLSVAGWLWHHCFRGVIPDRDRRGYGAISLTDRAPPNETRLVQSQCYGAISIVVKPGGKAMQTREILGQCCGYNTDKDDWEPGAQNFGMYGREYLQ